MIDSKMNEQVGPYPYALQELVEGLTYRQGWGFTLNSMLRGQECLGLTFVVTTKAVNAYRQDERIRVAHYFPVPAAAYDRRSWTRWLLECLRDVESHECCEFFAIDGDHVYAPSHGPGNDPYMIREIGTDLDARTSFRGDVKEETHA